MQTILSVSWISMTKSLLEVSSILKISSGEDKLKQLINTCVDTNDKFHLPVVYKKNVYNSTEYPARMGDLQSKNAVFGKALAAAPQLFRLAGDRRTPTFQTQDLIFLK